MKFKGENSNCYSTATQPSATAPAGSTTAELSGDRRDDEISVPASSVTNNVNDAAQMDIYRDLILRHLIQDINTTCTKLGLPTGHSSLYFFVTSTTRKDLLIIVACKFI